MALTDFFRINFLYRIACDENWEVGVDLSTRNSPFIGQTAE